MDSSYKEKLCLKGHQCIIDAIIQLKNNYYASVSNANSIKIWDNINYTQITSLIGHTGHVTNIIQSQHNDTILISGSIDYTIRIWDMNLYKCMIILQDHTNAILCLKELSNGELVSGSRDSTIKIWNMTLFTCKGTLKNHKDSIMQIIEWDYSQIVSCSWDNQIIIWNYDMMSSTCFLKVHTDSVICILKLMNGELASSSYDQRIIIWGKNNYQHHSLIGHPHSVNILIQLHNGELVSSSREEIRIWNITAFNCICILNDHSKQINCLVELTNNTFVSCSDDKTIKLWYNHKCIQTLIGKQGSIKHMIQSTFGEILSCSYDIITIWS